MSSRPSRGSRSGSARTAPRDRTGGSYPGRGRTGADRRAQRRRRACPRPSGRRRPRRSRSPRSGRAGGPRSSSAPRWRSRAGRSVRPASRCSSGTFGWHRPGHGTRRRRGGPSRSGRPVGRDRHRRAVPRRRPRPRRCRAPLPAPPRGATPVGGSFRSSGLCRIYPDQYIKLLDWSPD